VVALNTINAMNTKNSKNAINAINAMNAKNAITQSPYPKNSLILLTPSFSSSISRV